MVSMMTDEELCERFNVVPVNLLDPTNGTTKIAALPWTEVRPLLDRLRKLEDSAPHRKRGLQVYDYNRKAYIATARQVAFLMQILTEADGRKFSSAEIDEFSKMTDDEIRDATEAAFDLRKELTGAEIPAWLEVVRFRRAKKAAAGE